MELTKHSHFTFDLCNEKYPSSSTLILEMVNMFIIPQSLWKQNCLPHVLDSLIPYWKCILPGCLWTVPNKKQAILCRNWRTIFHSTNTLTCTTPVYSTYALFVKGFVLRCLHNRTSDREVVCMQSQQFFKLRFQLNWSIVYKRFNKSNSLVYLYWSFESTMRRQKANILIHNLIDANIHDSSCH